MKPANGSPTQSGINPFDVSIETMRRTVHQAMRVHKLLGHSVVVLRDGQVVWVPPEEIPDFEDAQGPLDVPYLP